MRGMRDNRTETPARRLMRKMLGTEKISPSSGFEDILLSKKTDRLVVPLSAEEKTQGGGITASIDGEIFELPIPLRYSKGRKKIFTLYWLAVEKIKKLKQKQHENKITKPCGV